MIEKKVLILGEHPVFLTGLKYIINNTEGFMVSDNCQNSTELFFSLSLLPADILLIDCSCLTNDFVLELLVNRLSDNYPGIALVTMGDCELHSQLSEQLKPAIKAYFCKRATIETLTSGLQMIKQELFCQEYTVSEKCNDNETNYPIKTKLTFKEKKVLSYLSAGLSVTQTALRLNRSVKTISSQKRRAMLKLGITQNRDIFKLNINEL